MVGFPKTGFPSSNSKFLKAE